MTTAYGTLYAKDSSGNLVQILPRGPYYEYSGAGEDWDGVAGLVPAAMSSNRNNFLRGDGTWTNVLSVVSSAGYVTDSYVGSAVADKITSSQALDAVSSAGYVTSSYVSGATVASAGNASTVNGLTVLTAVPASAVFTDTTYSSGTSTQLSSGTDSTGMVWPPNVLSAYIAGATVSSASDAASLGGVPASGYVTISGDQTVSGAKTFANGPYGSASAVSAAAINIASGSVFTKTISSNTTFTISGTPSSAAATFNLILTNGGSKTITWPSSVKWADNTAPDLTSSGVDVLTFVTPNGGTTWYGTVAVAGASA